MPQKSLLPDTWNVPHGFRRRVRESVGRQRAMFADGHLLLVLHEPPKADETHRRARLFWRSPDGSWESNNLGPGIGALQRHVNEYTQAVEKLDAAEERAEMADEYFRLLRDIAPLHRAARNMADAFQAARQMVSEDHDLILCRDQAYHVYRAVELLQGDMKIGLDCAIARRAEEQAESGHKMAVAAHRLNVLAAIFFPIVTISSIFGMNLDHGLGRQFDPWLFWLLLGVGVTCGFFLKDAIMQRLFRAKEVDRIKQV